MLFTVYLLTAAGVAWWAWGRLVLWRRLSWISGPPALPLFGNLFNFSLLPPTESFKQMTLFNKKYGGIYKLWLGSQPVVHCQDEEIVNLLLKQESSTKKAELYHFMGNFIGKTGLLTSETDEKWKTHRKLLSPSFHIEILEAIIQDTLNKANILTKYLEKNQQQAVDLIKFMKPSAFDTSMKSMAGLESNTLEKEDSHCYLDAVERMSSVVMSRVFLPLLKYNVFFSFTPMSKVEQELINTMKQFSVNVVNRKEELLKKNQEGTPAVNSNKKRKSILETLLDANSASSGKLSKENIADEINTHIFAGYDTLATSTSFALFLIGHHPNIQKKLLEELDQVMPNFPHGEVSLKEINQLDLLDRCFKESMRLFPPAPMIGRKVNSPIKTSKGTLPPGLNVYINIYNYHRNSVSFSNPDKFDPDRFIPENADRRKPGTYIPFGAGLRICIGQKFAMLQGKLFIASILKKFVIKSVDRMEDLELVANLVLKSETGIIVKLDKRG